MCSSLTEIQQKVQALEVFKAMLHSYSRSSVTAKLYGTEERVTLSLLLLLHT